MSACERCGGTGFEIVSKGDREFAQACACRQTAPNDNEDAFLDSYRIPPRYEHCNLGSFEIHDPAQSAALQKVMKYCAGYPYLGEDEGLGLLFIGDNGVGKTHLAVSTLRELATGKRVRGQFWDFHELIREIRNSYDLETRTTEVQVLQPVITTDLLLLDDLGAWKMTDWMLDTLFYILNSRYMAKRATVITTNFQDIDPARLANVDHSVRKEFLVERIGPRVRSRLMEMCLVVRMDGPDYRQTRQSSKRAAVLGKDAAPDTQPTINSPRPRFGG